jgi:hypothetical protein
LTRGDIGSCIGTVCFVSVESLFGGGIDGEDHTADTMFGLRAVPPCGAGSIDGDGEGGDCARGGSVGDRHETREGAWN